MRGFFVNLQVFAKTQVSLLIRLCFLPLFCFCARLAAIGAQSVCDFVCLFICLFVCFILLLFACISVCLPIFLVSNEFCKRTIGISTDYHFFFFFFFFLTDYAIRNMQYGLCDSDGVRMNIYSHCPAYPQNYF